MVPKITLEERVAKPKAIGITLANGTQTLYCNQTSFDVLEQEVLNRNGPFIGCWFCEENLVHYNDGGPILNCVMNEFGPTGSNEYSTVYVRIAGSDGSRKACDLKCFRLYTCHGICAEQTRRWVTTGFVTDATNTVEMVFV